MNKAIAQAELKIFGGIPQVTRYWDDSREKSIDVLRSLTVPYEGIQSCASIGVSSTDIGLMSNGKSLRVEILGGADASVKAFPGIMASAGFEIMKMRKCFPGYIVKNVIAQYIPDSDMKHILLTDPFIWENAESIEVDECCVAWLMAVPISEKELKYAQRNGADALEAVFEKRQADIYDLYRESLV